MNNRYTYDLRNECINGTDHYYAASPDFGWEVEISKPIYDELEYWKRIERNLQRADERHIDKFQSCDLEKSDNQNLQQKSVDEIVEGLMLMQKLYQIVAQLPQTQRRRFLYYFEIGLNYEEIAKKEGCTARAVQYSVQIAKKKLKKILESDFGIIW